MVESLGHDHGADDVRDGAVDDGGGVDGDAVVLGAKDFQEVEDFRLNGSLDGAHAAAPVSHPQLLVEEISSLALPEVSVRVDDS